MCDTLVARTDDGWLFAKNSDRDPNEAQLLEWHPAGVHPPGSKLRCTWIEIPQVERTSAILISRPFWMWGAEMGANEHGLTIGNEAVFTTEPLGHVGLTGMDLLRLVLERATDVESGLEILVRLLETFGQGGGCGHEDRDFSYHNSFLLADGSQAAVLETAGFHWDVEYVTGRARSISNGLSIPAFASAFGDRVKTRVAGADRRRAITESCAMAMTSPTDAFAALRRHSDSFAVGPRWSRVRGGMGAPCMHAGGAVASSQTTASWVTDFTSTRPQHWATATSTPCVGLFKPVDVDHPVGLGPLPTDQADFATLWWRHERLARRCGADFEQVTSRIRPSRDAIERRWVQRRPSSEDCFAEADRIEAEWLREVDGLGLVDRRPRSVRRYWRIRNERAGVFSESA